MLIKLLAIRVTFNKTKYNSPKKTNIVYLAKLHAQPLMLSPLVPYTAIRCMTLLPYYGTSAERACKGYNILVFLGKLYIVLLKATRLASSLINIYLDVHVGNRIEISLANFPQSRQSAIFLLNTHGFERIGVQRCREATALCIV